LERRSSDYSDTVGNGDAGQAGAIQKRIGADAGDTSGNGIVSLLSGWTLDEGCNVFIKQHSILTAVLRVLSIYRDAGHVGAGRERINSDAGYTSRNGDAGQASPIECKTSNAGDTIGNRDAGQALAVTERRTSDAGHAAGYGDAGQLGAWIECGISDGGDTVRNRDAGEIGAIIECVTADGLDAIGNGNAGEAETV